VIEVWKFPPQRIYATIYQPDKSKNDPAERDDEAWNFWAEKFRSVGLDPAVHIVNGNKKDNFWMMGETGPCGPCSELHVDLTPAGDTGGALVNKGTAECIEIWNLVFIQFNANPDGTFSPLPAQHVDTGMGFERVASIIQGTKAFSDFANAKISNYETDIFRPIFDEIEKLSGKQYGSTLPTAVRTVEEDGKTKQVPAAANDAEARDVAFRVIADHIRTLSFAIADGIQPGNNTRNYVLRRILRRAVRYGRTLGFHEPFFYKLVPVISQTMGDVFPEVRARQKHIEEVLKREEESFNKTLDRGIQLFNEIVRKKGDTEESWKRGLEFRLSNRRKLWLAKWRKSGGKNSAEVDVATDEQLKKLSVEKPTTTAAVAAVLTGSRLPANLLTAATDDFAFQISAHAAEAKAEQNDQLPVCAFSVFELADTYGFPLDLTSLMAVEVGGNANVKGAKTYAELQKELAQESQVRDVIELSEIETKTPTHFIGYDHDHTGADVQEVLSVKGKTVVIANNSVCYAEMGGQVGDSGEITGHGANAWRIANTQKSGNTWLHFLEEADGPAVGDHVTIQVDTDRRGAIQRHHSVTHLLHWALHEVVSKEATQKGSFVGPDKLTFDFNSAALTPVQVRDIERLVNERIVENTSVSWIEVPYADVRGRADIMQFFGDKYGETVRVVQIGGHATKLDGYSMELCAGTHTRATGEIGLFRINAESAIAAGVRRIEAVAGLNAYDLANADTQRLHALATKIGTPLPELEKRIDGLLAQQKELEKALKAAQQREAAGRAKDLLASAETINGTPAIIANLGAADGDTLQTVADALKSHGFKGVTVLGGTANGAVALVAAVSADFTAKAQAGKIIQAIAPIVGGKGGGKPEGARGGGKDPTKLDEALAQVKALLG
ncbi:MAG: alanine--tRNA ligase-related protein, partial [Chthoniobacter sp.]|uniref:alanine--tRNA ligase n=1 Tax=Chthoniobacter sp. TaxID=2510640 RepID=UPI0032ADD191